MACFRETALTTLGLRVEGLVRGWEGGKGGWERITRLVMGQFYPRPVPRSVSCEAGPHLVPGPCRSNAGLGGPRGFPLGTAANHVGHGAILPPTSAPQRELRGGTPLGPGPGPVQYWVGWALRIPTKGTTALSK